LVDAETARICKTKIRSVFANIFRTVVTVQRNPLKLKRMSSFPSTCTTTPSIEKIQ
jgi:hypothetical protein